MNELERELYDIVAEEPGQESSDDGIPAPIDYDDPLQVRDLVSQHLAKIFIATHKDKIRNELDKLKAICK